MCEMIGEKLNNEYLYQSFIIYFAFVESNCSFHNCDGLKKYLTKTLNDLNENLFMMTGNKILTAIVRYPLIQNKNELRNKIVKYYNRQDPKILSSHYKLEVICCEDVNYEPFKPFDYWLSQSIYKIEKRGKKWDYNFYIQYDYDDTFVNRLYNSNYIEKFRESKTHATIQKYLQDKEVIKRQKIIHTKKMKVIQKDLFIIKIRKHFSFTDGYLPKKIVCDLLDLDDKSKKDIKYLNNMLTDYGVEYDRQKMIKGNYGVFFGISLKS
jgi:hypothetical protein